MFGVYMSLLLVELMSAVLFLVYINLPIPHGLDVPTDSTCMLAFLNESPGQYVEIERLIEQAVQFQTNSSVIFVVRNVSFIITMKILKTIVFPSKVLHICNEFAMV
jgi:hypothetical protein